MSGARPGPVAARDGAAGASPDGGRHAAGAEQALAAALPDAGPGTRLIVLATSDEVGAGAIAWAEMLRRAGWCHRVRVVEPPHDVGAEACAGIVAEATAFGARAIVAEADGPAGAIAREVAAAAGLPLVSFPRATP